MKRSDRLLKKNREQTNTTPSDRNNNSSTRGKRSDRLLKNPIQEKTVPITFVDGKKTSVLKSATTAAPKVTTSKKDKSYNGVDAEINRREASRSARYSMQPEVRAAEIKRAEARGDTKRASELKKATDIEQWAKEQVNSDFVRSRAQTIYDNEFNAAKARGDQSPAVAAEHAAQGYLDLFRNKPQETKDASYFYRQAEKLQEAASVFNAEDFGIMSERGKAIGANLGGKLPKNEYEKIMAFVNNEPYRDSIEALAIMNHGDSNLAKQIRQFTEDEKNIIRYYAARGEKDKVEEFYKLMERELNRRLQTEVNEQTRQEAYDKPILGAAKNVVGTMASPAAYVANAGNAVANIFRDEYVPTDYNTPAFRGAHMAEQTSAGVTERASDAAGGGAKGEFASLVAGTGLSIANQLATLPMGAAGSLAYMSAEAAGQTTLDALKRGASAEQALLLSSAEGAIEAMTEKIPLDNLFKVAGEVGEKGLKNFIKTLVKEAPKQGLTEAGEEIISEIANTIMDIVVMKEKSGYEQYIAELMKDGKSRAEAGKEALIGYVGKNVLGAGVQGLLSGFIMGGGAATVSHARGAMQSRNAGVAEGEAGFTKTEFSDKVSNKTIRALNAIGKALGVNISIGAPTGNAPGAYNGYYQNGNIVIAQDTEDPLKVVLSHEVTHHLQKYNPEAYGKFLEIAVNASEELTGIQKNEMLEGYKKWFSEGAETEFTDAETLDEVAADFAGKIVDNLDLFRSLVRSDMTVAERFVESVKDFITKVKSTFSKDKSKMDTASLDKYGVRISELEEATKQWSEMLKATKAEAKSGNVKIENTINMDVDGGENSGIRFSEKGSSEDLSIKQQIKEHLDELNRMDVVVSVTGRGFDGRNKRQVRIDVVDKLKASGYAVERKDIGKIIFTESEIDDALKYLGTDAEILAFKALPRVLKRGIIIDGHDNHKSRGFPTITIAAPVELNGMRGNMAVVVKQTKGNRYKVHRITTPEGTAFNLQKNNEADSTTGEPFAISKRESPIESASINSISDSTEKSNPQFSEKKNTDNLGRELSDGQAEYFKDSKVRDKDGNLLVMYRGGNEDFTVFDRKKSKYSNLYGRGFYFTDSESHAKQYGNVRAYYLDIKNPVSTTEKTITKEQLRAYLEAVAENEDDYSFENYGYGATVDSVLESVYEGKSDFNMLYDISQTAIGDMVEAVELFNEVNGTDYDGLILDTETVTFKSNQAKSVDNKKPTENPDIRYSMKGKNVFAEPKTEEEAQLRELKRENAKQKKLIEQLKARMKDMSPNHIPGKVDEKAVRSAAREIISRYGATIKVKELAPKLQDLWDKIGTGKNLSGEEVFATANEIAREIAESAIEKDDTMYQEFAGLRKFCRETEFSISESDRAYIAYFNDFRKHNMGRMRITSGATNIDTIYRLLGEMYPEMFNEEDISHPADQLVHIADVLDDVYNIVENNLFKNHMDYAVGMIANDILETFYEIPETKKTLKDLKIEKLTRTVAEKSNTVKNTVKELEQHKKTAEREMEKLLSAYKKEQIQRAKDKEKYRENKSKLYEEQRKRETRGKIIRSFDRLAQLATRPTDKRHIPEGLKSAVKGFLGCINFNNEWAIDAKTGHVVKRLPPEMERRELLPTRKTVKYEELRAQFKEAAQEITFADEFFEGSEDGESGNLLMKVKDLSDTTIYDMTEKELRDVYTAMRIVEKAIQHGNEMFAEGVAATRADTAYAILRESEPKKRKFDFGQLTTYNYRPYTFFHALGETGDRLFRALREAQDKRTLLLREIRKFNDKNLAEIKSRELEKEKKKVTLGGEDVEISTAQLMELYLLNRRDQGKKHIFGGGIILKERKNFKEKMESEMTRRIRVTEEEIGRALEELTSEQKRIAEKISGYVTDYIGGMMDEECLKVFGYKKFGEKNYWPIDVDPNEIKGDKKNAGAGEIVRRIGSYGMAQATSPTATTAIRIGSIFDTYAEHCAQAANYAAFLGVSEDMYHIGNFSFYDAEGDNPKNMNEVLAGVFGQSGVKYWKRLDEDISAGNARFGNEKSPLAGLTNISKAKAVSLNFRVWMQQYSAILRAGDELNYAYIAAGAPTAISGWNKALKYSPIAMWKSWGFYDANTGPTMRSIIIGDDGTLEKIRSGAMAPAGWMDSLGWGTIWNACELETKARRKKEKTEVSVGSAEFYEEVKARFEEIIDRTQVVDGVLQRSHNMRSKNELVNMSTSFMGEPTTQVNEIFCAAIDIKRAKTGAEKRRAGKRLARTCFAQLLSLTANALFGQSLVDAWRDDDREKKYWERVLGKFVGDYSEAETATEKWKEFFSSNFGENLNPLSYFPYLKDIKAAVSGYEAERMDMTLVNELVSTYNSIRGVMSGESTSTVAEVSAQGIATLAGFLGIGVGNLKKDLRGALLTIARATESYLLEYRIEKLTKNIKNEKNAADFIDILYEAKQKDKEAYDIIYRDMVKNGYKKEDIDKKITTYTSGKFDRALSDARKAKEAENATAADKVIYRHLNREKNMTRDVRAGDEETVIANLDKYRKNVERYLKEYPGEDEEKQIDYAYRKANFATYGAEYAIRASGGKSVYDKALEKVKRGKTTWKEYYEEYFGRDERRYERLRDKYDITYAEYEKIAEVMAKNSTEEEEIEALHKLGYKRSTARGIRRNFNKVK